jgi:catechol 2,3-dioxygenase-like lactoylglutathione lyase family enzyme
VEPLAAIWLVCRDVGRSISFYRDTLGLEQLADEHFDAGGIRLSLHPQMGDGDLPPRGSFLVFVVDDVDARYDELRARGVEFAAPPAEEPFGRAVEFRDPDGHVLWLWQLPAEDDPRRAAVEPHARHHSLLIARLGRHS